MTTSPSRAPIRRRSRFAAMTVTLLAGTAACSGNAGQTAEEASTAAQSPAGASCANVATVRVSVPAAIKDIVSDRARAIEGSHCATYEVSAEPGHTVASRDITKESGPDFWIADSSVWPLEVLAKKPNSLFVYPEAFATSPVALAVPASIAAQGKVPTGTQPMRKQLVGASPALQVAKPGESSVSLIHLLSAWVNTGTDRAGQVAVTKAFVPVARTTATDDQLYERAVPGSREGAAVFPASEQGMAAFNAKHPDAQLTALGAAEGLGALKFVATRPADAEAAVQKAADALAVELRGDAAKSAFRNAGFRVDGTGTVSVPGMPKDPTISLDAPAPQTLRAVTSLLTALGHQVRMVLVIDTSGSMLDPSGYGGTRIELTGKAVQTALNFVPPGTEASLWQMASNRQFGRKDYRVVVPMTRLAGDDGNLLPAAIQFANAFDAIVPSVGGGTGLYDTFSDAYTLTAKEAASDVNNVIVLLTDGRNEDDPDSISLTELLSRIKTAQTPDKPVRVALAGLGPYSDMAALRAIADATGGTASVVTTETSLSDVIVEAMIPKS